MQTTIARSFAALVLAVTVGACGTPDQTASTTWTYEVAPPTIVADGLASMDVTPPTTAPAAPRARRAPSRPRAHAAAATAPVVARIADCGGWRDLIASMWPADQVDRACRVMMCESGGDPTNDRNRISSASGLWQFLDGTWRGVTGRGDRAINATAEEQTAAAFRLWQSSGWSAWQCRG